MGNRDSYGLTEDSTRGSKAKDDLRRFKAIPTQFYGEHASHLPSYDKMSFWSIIIDLLLDIAVNVKPDLSAKDVMGYISPLCQFSHTRKYPAIGYELKQLGCFRRRKRSPEPQRIT